MVEDSYFDHPSDRPGREETPLGHNPSSVPESGGEAPLANDPDLIDFDPRWVSVQRRVQEQFGKKPDLQAMLYLIGMQELGRLKKKWSKEEKQNLMHIAVCRLLSQAGYYIYVGLDEDGWPHFEATAALPKLSVKEQELLLKQNIIQYFEAL